MSRKYKLTIGLVLLILASAGTAFAHAILVHSTPADHAVVHSRMVDITLDYNSRIEASRCVLTLTNEAGSQVPVQMRGGTAPSELKAVASNLTNGTYHVHWQVLASDGHITRGEITFTVAGASPRGSQRP